MLSYRVDLASICEDLGASVTVSDALDLGELVVGDERFALLQPAAFRVEITNTGTGFVASGEVAARVSAECARCLRSFETTLTGTVEGFYVQPGRHAEMPDEQEVEPVEDGAVDLVPAILAALTLEAPFAPLHDPDCAGICPGCGADLNEGACTCPPAPAATDSPFVALKDLLPDEDGEQR